MIPQYHIIIEVDNKRALAAYTRGLEHLDAAWPRLMEVAQAEDAEHVAAQERIKDAAQKAAEEREREYQKKLGEYLEEKVEYLKWERGSKWFRGPPPVVPEMPFRCSPSFLPPIRTRWSSVSLRKLTRAGLVSKRNMAAVAIGPFSMSEQDANAMVRWESGEIVEQMLAETRVQP